MFLADSPFMYILNQLPSLHSSLQIICILAFVSYAQDPFSAYWTWPGMAERNQRYQADPWDQQMRQADFSAKHSITTEKSGHIHTAGKTRKAWHSKTGHKHLERKKGKGRTICLNEPGRIYQWSHLVLGFSLLGGFWLLTWSLYLL